METAGVTPHSHSHIHPHIHSSTHPLTHPHIHTHTSIRIHAHTPTHTHIHTQPYTHTHTDTFTHTRSRMLSERPGGPWRNTGPTISAPGGGLRSLSLDVVWKIDCSGRTRCHTAGRPRGAERRPAQQDTQAQAVAWGLLQAWLAGAGAGQRCTQSARRARGKGSVNSSSVGPLPPPQEVLLLPSRAHLLGDCPESQE